MGRPEDTLPPPRVRPWRTLPILVLLGLAVHLLVPQLTALERSWSVLLKLTWWAVGLAMAAQGLSYAGSGYLLHAILRNNRRPLSIARGIWITMAAYSVGLIAGGWVGGAAATYSWVRRESRDGNSAALAGTLPSLLNNAVLAGIAAIGVLHLLLVHDLTRQQGVAFCLALMLLALLTGGVLAALRSPDRLTRLALRLTGLWARIRRQVSPSDRTVAAVERFVQAWQELGGGRWLHPALGALANIGFDMGTLYFMFLAAGYRARLGVLFAGYGLPFLLAKIAFFFPGGVGVVEASMVAMFESLQVPSQVSVVVILGYRLISFWIPSLLGFAAAAALGGGVLGPGQGSQPPSAPRQDQEG